MAQKYLQREMRYNFESQPENVSEESKTIVYVDMDEIGNTIDFAEIACELWNKKDPSGKVPANNHRKPDKNQCLSHTKLLFERRKMSCLMVSR